MSKLGVAALIAILRAHLVTPRYARMGHLFVLCGSHNKQFFLYSSLTDLLLQQTRCVCVCVCVSLLFAVTKPVDIFQATL